MKNYIIDIKEHISNRITEELEQLEQNQNIKFINPKNKDEFIYDLLLEMLEQYENDIAYYGTYNPNFADSVFDKIQWDKDYYQIEIMED